MTITIATDYVLFIVDYLVIYYIYLFSLTNILLVGVFFFILCIVFWLLFVIISGSYCYLIRKITITSTFVVFLLLYYIS